MNPATIVFIGSAFAVIGSLLAGYGAYLGANQDAKDSKHLLASLTGGDSHPLIIATPSDGSFFVSITGEYPLHEASGQIFDISDLREQQAKGVHPGAPIPRAQAFELGTLSSAYGTNLINRATGRQINIKDYKQRNSYRFMVHLYSRHHTFNFRLALEPHDEHKGAWHQAWEIFRDQEKEPLAKSIPDDFPVNSVGKVDFLLMPVEKKDNANK